MDKTTLEHSIKQEAVETLAKIREQETQEIQRLAELLQTEIEKFGQQTKVATDEQIQQELVKLQNKSILARQKMKLLDIDNFINQMVNEVISGIRESPRYPQFLFQAVREATTQFPSGAEVRIKTEDLTWEEEILKAAGGASRNPAIAIQADLTIRWGGCLVLDEAGGRIFNRTLERIYFRKSVLIRRKVMQALLDHAGEEKTRNSLAPQP